MSFEGLNVFICPNGHVDYKYIYSVDSDKCYCEFCDNVEMEFIGIIDETNGDSMTNIYLEKIEDGYRMIEIRDGVKYIEAKEPRFKYRIGKMHKI